jgi:TolA-binding protein
MRSPIRLALFGVVIGAIAIPLGLAGEENGKSSEAPPADSIAELKERIKQLESRVQELEQSQVKLKELLRQSDASPRQRALDYLQGNQSPDGQANGSNPFLILPPAASTLNGQPVPPNWTPHEFNGGTYCIVPLAKKP